MYYIQQSIGDTVYIRDPRGEIIKGKIEEIKIDKSEGLLFKVNLKNHRELFSKWVHTHQTFPNARGARRHLLNMANARNKQTIMRN